MGRWGGCSGITAGGTFIADYLCLGRDCARSQTDRLSVTVSAHFTFTPAFFFSLSLLFSSVDNLSPEAKTDSKTSHSNWNPQPILCSVVRVSPVIKNVMNVYKYCMQVARIVKG